jgi:hypothetical protein
MRSGKSTVSSMLTEQLFGMTISFAAPFYDFIVQIAAPFLPGGAHEARAWLLDERKDCKVIPELGVTLRFLLQSIGTHWGRRHVHNELWTMIAEKKAQKALKSYSVIFDDMRFPDEYAMVKRNGGKNIRIIRPGRVVGDTSIGEGLLDRLTFDYTILNDGSLTDLRQTVGEVAEDLKAQPK